MQVEKYDKARFGNKELVKRSISRFLEVGSLEGNLVEGGSFEGGSLEGDSLEGGGLEGEAKKREEQSER